MQLARTFVACLSGWVVGCGSPAGTASENPGDDPGELGTALPFVPLN